MGLKGINPVEQHAEKVFAGVFVVSLLGVLAWQFVGKPNTVKVGKDDVPLTDAYNKIAEEARRTDAKVRSGAPELPADGGEALKKLEQFDQRLQGPVSPARELASALGEGGIGLKGFTAPVGAGAAAFAQVVVPAPTRPISAAHMALIDAAEAKNPEVAKILPAVQPLDKAAVSVETTLDGTALRHAFTHDPDGDGPIMPLPKNWWEGNVQLLAVLGERQVQKSDGSWSDPEPVMAMPGRLSLVNDLSKLNTAAAIKQAMTLATEQEKDVRRPDYYAVRMGEQWAPPSEREKLQLQEGEKSKRIADLKRRRDVEVRRRDALSKQLGGAGGGAGGRNPPPGGGRGTPPPPPRGGGGRSGGGGAGGNQPPSGPNANDQARQKSLQAQLEKAEQAIATIEDELRQLGDTSIGGPAPVPAVPANASKANEPGLLDTANVRLWLHDVNVERGKTYRYRTAIAINNPFFGHGAAMKQDQQEWAAPGTVRGEWSEWSSPVTVAPETMVFITSANEDNQVDRAASAKAEVFYFRWGFWRQGLANVQPGDAISAQVRVPDYSKLITMEAPDPNQPGNPGAPAGPRSRTGGAPAAPGGGRGVQPPQDAGPSTTPPPMQQIDLGATNPMVFLGVGTGEVANQDDRPRATLKVFVRDANGVVTVRYPEDEREDLAYRRASESAERGKWEMTQPTQPQTRPNPGNPGRQDVPPPPPDRAPPPGGG
jgi:hypothetical protein